MKILRQSTGTIIQVGPILGTDFLAVQTGLSLATGHAELFKAGATTAIDISGRTWAHISGGVYALTLTAGDLDTAGPLLINLHITSTQPQKIEANVFSTQAYDSILGSNYMWVNILQVFSSANAALQLANGLNTSLTVSVGAGSTTTVVASNLTSAVSNMYNGRTLVFLTGALAGQACTITGYNGTTKTLTVSALTSAPSSGDTAVIV